MTMQKFVISLEGLPGTGMLMHSSRLSNRQTNLDARVACLESRLEGGV